MKTTVEIPDDVFAEAKALAAQERTTLRALLLEGLRWALRQRKVRRQFQLRDASVDGEGVQAGIAEGSWAQVRDLAYDGRGS